MPTPTQTVSGAALGGALRPSLADLRLAGPAAVTWIVVAVLVGEPDAVGPVAASAAVVGLASLVVLLRPGLSVPVRAVAALVLTTSLLIALTAAAVAAGQEHRLPSIVRQTAGHSLEARVRLDRDLTPGDRSVVGTIETVVGRASRSDGLRVPVRLVPALDEPRRAVLAAGTVVSVRGQLQRDDPGSATSVVLFARGAVATRAGPTGLLGASADARAAFVAVTADLPEPGGALLRGLAIGDRSGLDAETEQAMETSALTHLTAVSGSNCAVLVGLVVLLGRLTGAPRVLRAAAAVVVLLGFVVLVRPDPSITRATVMAIVVLVVHLSGRPVRGVPLIALAAVGMLVADPWVARSFAFALSVLATVGIVVLAAPLTDLLARWVWTPVAAAVAIPIAAQVACWPVTIPLAPALPTYAVPANLLAEVLAPVATIVGLAACLLAPVWPVGAGLLATVGWVPAAGIGLIAHGAAGLPVASAPWPSGPGGVVAAGVVSAALAVGVLVRARLRRVLSGVAALTVIVGIGSVTVPAVLVRGSVPTGWTIAMCDVGQGDATLLRSAGRTALVDTGDDDARLTACLALLGVDRIDLLVLTHFDRDHVGAVASVATRVETALVGPVGRPADDRVVGDLRSAGVDVRQAADRTTGLLGDLRWQVLWPPEGDERAGNAASLVLRVDPAPERPCPGCVSAVLLGDLGEDAQRRLSRSAPPEALAPVDVVKVAHHGSADQDPELYRALAARVGLIGVGADNDYGHPTPSALEMLAAAGTLPYRTARSGTIVVRGGSDTGDEGDAGDAGHAGHAGD
ncbi:ComEC/Rec2 family competence protein, partial [Curtobacterium sp. APC 4022]|uniref:ComEC/Rec2 family competence protein n=1 Tax=Curtobacterium sp. APC 4022 TaxID=3035201 RepID=UPI0025B588BF